MMRGAWLSMIAALAVAGCSTEPPRVGDPPPSVPDSRAEAAYRQVFNQSTERTAIYDGLDTRLFAAATEESPAFVAARAERMAIFEALPEAAAQALESRELAQASKSYEFFLGVHTDVRRVNDFEREGSIWRVALKSQAGEVTPTSIDRVSRPNDNLRGIYLYLSDFWVGYRVVFPKVLPSGAPLVGPGDTQVTLKLDSSMGHARLTFPAIAP